MDSPVHLLALDPPCLRAHLEELVRLDAAVFGGTAWSAEQFQRDLDGKWRLSFLALEGDRTIGFSVTSRHPDPGSAHLHRIAVDREHRGSGVGRALLARTREALATAGVERWTLEMPEEQGAGGFYQRLGFRRLALAEEIEKYLRRRQKEHRRPEFIGPGAFRGVYQMELGRGESSAPAM